MDHLLHIKVSPKLKERMQNLLDSGLFENHAEIVREGLRDLFVEHGGALSSKKR